MAKKATGVIYDDRSYTHIQIAEILGRTDRWAREFIRGTVQWEEKGHHGVPFADLGNGLIMVSGRLWREAIEAMSLANAKRKE